MEKKKSKIKKDKLGMEPAVHRKELENKIKKLENGFNTSFEILEEVIESISAISKKIDQICTRMGLSKL